MPQVGDRPPPHALPPCGSPCAAAPAGRSLNSLRSDNATGLPRRPLRRRGGRKIGGNLSPTCSGGGGEAGSSKSALGTLAEIGGELANDRNAAICRTHTFGQYRPLENLLQSCRSIQGSLQTGHSIGVIDFSGLNFGYERRLSKVRRASRQDLTQAAVRHQSCPDIRMPPSLRPNNSQHCQTDFQDIRLRLMWSSNCLAQTSMFAALLS